MEVCVCYRSTIRLAFMVSNNLVICDTHGYVSDITSTCGYSNEMQLEYGVNHILDVYSWFADHETYLRKHTFLIRNVHTLWWKVRIK